MEVLLSCMSSSPIEVVKRTNVVSDITVVNQCSNDCISKTCTENGYRLQIIDSSESGLSKSRNMAIRYAGSDICLLCDDDEILYDNYANLIESAFKENPDADLCRIYSDSRTIKAVDLIIRHSIYTLYLSHLIKHII